MPPHLATSTTQSLHSTYLTNPDHHWLHPLSTHRRGPRTLLTYVDEARQQLRKRIDDNPNCKLRQHTSQPSMTMFAPDILQMNDSSDDDGRSAIVERRIMSILTSDTVRKAMLCGCSHHRQSAIHQVRLRVLRELGLADDLCTLDRIDSTMTPSTLSDMNHTDLMGSMMQT